MADTTEAVERITEALNAIRLFAQDSIEHDGDARATLANLYGIRDTVDNLRGEVDFRALSYQHRALLSERTALLERVERAEAGNLHPLAEKVWQQSCQGWMDRAQAAETKLATLTEALLDATGSLIAAVSLLEHGGKKAAASDKMFKMMLADYRKSIARARAALSQTQEEANG